MTQYFYQFRFFQIHNRYKLKIIKMLRQFLSVRHNNDNKPISLQEAIHRRTKSSAQRIEKHKLLGKKIMTINDRVQKIKSKYGSYINLKQNFIQSQSQFLTTNTYIANKQNESALINTSVNLHLNERTNEMKVGETQYESRRKKKPKQWQKIHELEEINMKISMLIQNLKDQEKQQFQSECKQNIQVDTFQPAEIRSNHPLNQFTNFYQYSKDGPNIIDLSSLNVTKLTNAQSKRSRIKTQESVNSSKRSNKSTDTNSKYKYNQNQISQSKSKRQNGKLTHAQTYSSSLKKSRKQLDSSLILDESKQINFIRAFAKQIQLDEKFIKSKTKLMKLGKNIKSLLHNAVQNTQLTIDQKQIVLQFNFQDIDPFFTERNSLSKRNQKQDQNLLVYSVIDCFLTCQDHWKRKIYKKFNRKEINLSDLDIEEKGYFLKQDFTRFLSLKTRKMYYNRQINLLFRRINQKKTKIVSVNQLVNNLCF